MIWKPRSLRFVAMALLAAACSSDPVDVNPQTTSQVVLDGKMVWESPTVFVLVVDDANTAEAAKLRERVAQSVRASLLAHIESRWGTCGSADPAEWHTGEIRFVVARPSAPDDAVLLTPEDVPALAWITQTSKAEEVDAVVEGVTEALAKRIAVTGEVYRPLRAAKNVMDLVTGARAPTGASETAFVASLSEVLVVRLLVASTRDDEDAEAVSTYELGKVDPSIYVVPTVVGPFTLESSTCQVFEPGGSRLATWGKLSDALTYAESCDDQDGWDGILHPGWADCGSLCHDKPLVVSADGVAECKVMIDQVDLELCDPARGMHDPGGQPTFVDRHGKKLRRCEVDPLEGADLEGCRHSLECSGCASGFCVTEVPELVSQSYCEPSQQPWPLRFIGGAREAPDGWINITCVAGEGE
ncbi:hypothetical protein [Polyangium aurulentum]|uniref:hypothetical protein n=1 Tax=Polyangium aurulentum TaxID=2567896 RepID=UPI0010AE0B61|nr:hypothetical protein [Polyangium aurulentum]UQA59198.1 hypothetical protein E8A73_001380 [Polyangium aurulentum]